MTAAIEIPDQLVRSWGATEPAWLAALPGLAADTLDRWELRLDGPQRNGMAGLILPVVRADGTPAVLKLQPLNADSAGVPVGLRAWGGDGIVRLLAYDGASGAQLLERLDPTRVLSAVPEIGVALDILAGLLARLTAHPAPPGLRQLGDIAAAMLAGVPQALTRLADPADRELLRDCAAAVAEVAGEPGDRLLHWDLHYDNVLGGEREPWLAIDPEPLAGDPGFDLLPALDNRWDDAVATGDVTRAVRYRFDLLTEAAGIDRGRAAAWSMGRVLQNSLWEIEDGGVRIDPVQSALGRIFRFHRRQTF